MSTAKAGIYYLHERFQKILGTVVITLYFKIKSTFGTRIWVSCPHLYFRWNALLRLAVITFLSSINWSHYISNEMQLTQPNIIHNHIWPIKHNTQSHYISDEMQSTQPNITHNHIIFHTRCNQPNIILIHICISKSMNSDHTLFKMRVSNVL